MLPIVIALVKKVAKYDPTFSLKQMPSTSVFYTSNQVGGIIIKMTPYTMVL